MESIRVWRDRLRRHFTRMLRYGVVGVGGLLADVGVFNLLRFAGGEGPLYDRPLTAKVVSTLFGFLVAWLGHRYWTFSDGRRKAAGRELLVFVVVCAIGLAISLACLFVSHYLMGLTSSLADNISANVIGLALATAFRYWAMHTHVFVGDRPSQVPALETPEARAVSAGDGSPDGVPASAGRVRSSPGQA